ncbi:MAG: type II secretion system protein [Candidatus Gracilibacteria bacterium]|jgi:prepilin-type N-terminal cleavage/methylation domain-containing protein
MKKGFTLIELLIVVAILGILAVAFLPSIMGAPGKARDTARLAEVSNIVDKIVAKDLAGTPPTSSGCIAGARTGIGTVPAAPTLLLATDFEKGFPQDPGGTTYLPTSDSPGTSCTGGYWVIYKAGGTVYRYLVVARVEDTAKGNLACPISNLNLNNVVFTNGGTCYGVGIK